MPNQRDLKSFFSSNLRTGLIPLVLGLVFCANAATPTTLNREKVNKLYLEGEFEKVIVELEGYRKQNDSMSDDDKIFVYKHLSVVYAANPDNREKAESYMYLLLELVPSVQLLDMYVSESIQLIFQNVRSEYERRMDYLKSKDEIETTKKKNPPDNNTVGGASTQNSEPLASAEGPSNSGTDGKESKKWIWWTAGGVAVAGGVTAFLILSRDSDSEPPPIIPDN